MSAKLLVIDVVGMTPDLLRHMPRVRRVGEAGFTAELGTVLPAVTCTVQSTFLTGTPPRDHGIVGNGWFFRDLGEVMFWRQHHGLVQGEPLWDVVRRRRPGTRVANVCWRYAMGMDVDTVITPRPAYHADGRTEPDCWTWPPELHDRLVGELGEFPLFDYWGPTASIASSKWIVAAARSVLPDHDLTLVYVPHLDYDLQKFGPDGPRAVRAARDVDAALAPLLDDAERTGVEVVLLSEYGIRPASRPVDVNRLFRREGLLHVHHNATGELLDPWTSRAFAVADHQLAHVYVKDPHDLPRVRELVDGLAGVDQVLDRAGQAAYGLGHERAGDLVLVAEPEAWFTYYYWLDDDLAPDFARGVEVHKKPGYDPAELFLDPDDGWVKLRAAATRVKKKTGLRHRMSAVPLDPAPVSGSHGRLPDRPEHGPVLVCSDPAAARERIEAIEVRDLLAGLLATAPVVARH